jgi:hypothetical protein
MAGTEYDSDHHKLFWQVEALKGQIHELERERDRAGNILWRMRFLLRVALEGMGVEAQYGRLSDAEILRLFEKQLKDDWRFSRCPNADKLHCRPVAMHITSDGDIVQCDDCGWDIRESPLPVEIMEVKEPPSATPFSKKKSSSRKDKKPSSP